MQKSPIYGEEQRAVISHGRDEQHNKPEESVASSQHTMWTIYLFITFIISAAWTELQILVLSFFKKPPKKPI